MTTEKEQAFNDGYNAAVNDLAQLVITGFEKREASYVPAEFSPGGNYIRGGNYGLTQHDAVTLAARELGIDERLIVPAQLTLTWTNDVIEWAKATLSQSK